MDPKELKETAAYAVALDYSQHLVAHLPETLDATPVEILQRGIMEGLLLLADSEAQLVPDSHATTDLLIRIGALAAMRLQPVGSDTQ